MTRLFYAPIGERPREITGRVFKHPVTAVQIHNPSADEDLDILELEGEAPSPDQRLHNVADTYARARDAKVVRMTWRSEIKPALPALPARLEELRLKAKEVGDTTSLDYTKEALDIAIVYKASNNAGPWYLYDVNGAWTEFTHDGVRVLVDEYAARLNEVMRVTRIHSEAMRGFAVANNLQALLDYDIEAGWPQ